MTKLKIVKDSGSADRNKDVTEAAAAANDREKHYAQPAENWLADATDWLREKLKIAEVFNSMKA